MGCQNKKKSQDATFAGLRLGKAQLAANHAFQPVFMNIGPFCDHLITRHDYRGRWQVQLHVLRGLVLG